jgi:hypothetical protein
VKSSSIDVSRRSRSRRSLWSSSRVLSSACATAAVRGAAPASGELVLRAALTVGSASCSASPRTRVEVSAVCAADAPWFCAAVARVCCAAEILTDRSAWASRAERTSRSLHTSSSWPAPLSDVRCTEYQHSDTIGHAHALTLVLARLATSVEKAHRRERERGSEREQRPQYACIRSSAQACLDDLHADALLGLVVQRGHPAPCTHPPVGLPHYQT